MTGDRPRVPTCAWDRPLFCHVPGDQPVDLDALADTRDGGDRWNEPGEPTGYLSSDVGVALVELGRHLAADALEAPRRVLRLDLNAGALSRLVDLRDERVLEALGLPCEPGQFLDRGQALDVARRLRAEPEHQGLIVPSMGVLDTTERCNVVVFADRVVGGIPGAVERWTTLGRFEPGEGAR